MKSRFFVDTNVWVYAIDQADQAKRDIARAATAPGSERDLVISSQVLSEFYAVATRKLRVPLTEDVAAAMVERLSDLPVVTLDVEVVRSAISWSREWGVSLWDAQILVAAELAGCEVVLSEDLSDGRDHGSVRVINPFA